MGRTLPTSVADADAVLIPPRPSAPLARPVGQKMSVSPNGNEGCAGRDAPREARGRAARRRAFSRAPRAVASAPRAERDPGTRAGPAGPGGVRGSLQSPRFSRSPSVLARRSERLTGRGAREEGRLTVGFGEKRSRFARKARVFVGDLRTRVSQRFSLFLTFLICVTENAQCAIFPAMKILRRSRF